MIDIRFYMIEIPIIRQKLRIGTKFGIVVIAIDTFSLQK